MREDHPICVWAEDQYQVSGATFAWAAFVEAVIRALECEHAHESHHKSEIMASLTATVVEVD